MLSEEAELLAINVITYALLLGSMLLLLDTLTLTRRGIRKGFYSNFFFILAAALLYATYATYLSDFFRDNFSYYGIYNYSTTTLPAVFKLAASWAGTGGSLFLWLFCQLTINIVYRFFRAHDSQGSIKPLLACNILTAALGFLSISTGAFNLLPSLLPAGEGLNPLLLSFWMLIHPPVTFLGYALSLTAAIVALLSDDKVSERILFGFAWVAMTAAIVIGGLWAYEALGWGGYWNWDAVETASLLPWLSMTIYFHSTMENRRKFAAALTGFFILFASFITRSGILESVHAYGLSPIGFAFLLSGVLFFIPYLRSRRNENTSPSSKRSLYSFFMTISEWSLILIILVCLIGVLMSIFTPLIGIVAAPSIDYYNRALFPFVMVFFAALIGCAIPQALSWRRFGGIVLTALVAGLLLALAKYPVENPLVNFGLPLIFTVLAVEFLSFAINARARRLRTLGRRLIHMAMPIILIGVFFSITMAWRQDATVPLGSDADVNGIRVSFVKYETPPPSGVLYVKEQLVNESSSVVLRFIVESNRQSSVIVDAVVKLYRLYGIVIQPIIMRFGTDDTYIIVRPNRDLYQLLNSTLYANGEKPVLNEIDVTVEHKSLINLIWLGSALLIIGGIVQTLIIFIEHSYFRFRKGIIAKPQTE